MQIPAVQMYPPVTNVVTQSFPSTQHVGANMALHQGQGTYSNIVHSSNTNHPAIQSNAQGVTNSSPTVMRYGINFNPLLPCNNPSRTSLVNDMSLAKHVLRQEIFTLRDEDLYDSKPTKFVACVENIRTQISNLGLNELEIIRFLRVSCKGEAKSIICQYECSLYANPTKTLDLIWVDLYNSLGQSKFIYRDIEDMINKFPGIKSKEHVTKIKDLSRLCNVIEMNKVYGVGSLGIFDMEPG